MGNGSGVQCPPHLTPSWCRHLQGVQRAQPLEGVRGDLRDLVVTQVSETQREKVAWSPLLLSHAQRSTGSRGPYPARDTQNWRHSRPLASGSPCHGKCPTSIGLEGCGLMAVASRLNGAGVRHELVGAEYLHPAQLLVGGESAWGDGLDTVELQASAKRRGREEGHRVLQAPTPH